MEKVNIVSISNFDLDDYDEYFVAKDVRHDFAQGIVNYLNENYSSADSLDYYVIRPRDYILKHFEP